ncbi:hypothetical protein GBA52_019709 [Prunus armeniaca]|nr:hypothetical protein GBA52_019709 [Prunus armeniaca]
MNGMVFLASSGIECIILGILDGWAMHSPYLTKPKRETSDLRIHVENFETLVVVGFVVKGSYEAARKVPCIHKPIHDKILQHAFSTHLAPLRAPFPRPPNSPNYFNGLPPHY